MDPITYWEQKQQRLARQEARRSTLEAALARCRMSGAAIVTRQDLRQQAVHLQWISAQVRGETATIFTRFRVSLLRKQLDLLPPPEPVTWRRLPPAPVPPPEDDIPF